MKRKKRKQKGKRAKKQIQKRKTLKGKKQRKRQRKKSLNILKKIRLGKKFQHFKKLFKKLAKSTKIKIKLILKLLKKISLKTKKSIFSILKKFFSSFKKFLSRKKIIFLTLAFLLSGFTIFIYHYVFKDLPSPELLKDYKITPLSTHIYDRYGRLLYEIYREENRTPVKLSTLPEYVKWATISIEDKDFYKHKGVSPVSGILRAIKDTILTKKLQGGSTITQQLIKTTLLTPERTIQRKLKEIVLALWAERLYSKDEILEMYLNQIPYGGAAYGIQEASKLYFRKDAKDLTLSEAALLAGLPKAPSLYSPYVNPDAAVKRRNEVLRKMWELGYISKEEYEKASLEKLNIKPPRHYIRAPHFVFYVKDILEKKYGRKVVEEGGLRVYTTLDLDIQEKAEQIIKEAIEKSRRYNITNAAALITRPPTGEILAMVGSYDYFATPSGAFNATLALRQPGSSIKPLNYAIGIERKLVTASTIFLDIPTCFYAPGQPKAYCPSNYDGRYHGPVQLRYALGNSYNIPAVKMLAINGVKEFIASASAFTITTFKDPTRYGLSLTLGGGEVKMTEMAQAFSAFANLGTPRKLNAILKVKDKFGKTIYEFKDPNFYLDIKKNLPPPKYLAIKGKRVISMETAFIISNILADNQARAAAFGYRSSLVIPGKTVSVKTGTTNNLRDNWAIGYTPNFLTAVWVGNNDNSPMRWISSGITGAAPIWNKIMRLLLENQENLKPLKPDGLVARYVCVSSGKLPTSNSNCQLRLEYFIKGTVPGYGGNIVKKMMPVNKTTGKITTPDDPEAEMQEKTIVQDYFSSYCIDCQNDNLDFTIIRINN